jgi:hypothetical protein
MASKNGPDRDLGGHATRITQNSVTPRVVSQSRTFFVNLLGIVVLGSIVWNVVAGRYLAVIFLGIVLAIFGGIVLFAYARSR